MSINILLVDDDGGVLRSLQRLLLRKGYKVSAFLRAHEALTASSKTSFQVVISDYRMPSINGTEFLTALREISPNTIRIMLSGEADREGVLSSINEAKIFHFLVKPWDDDVLLHTVSEAVSEFNRIGEIDVALDSHRRETDHDYRRRLEIEKLEKESPGITDVNWSDNDTIVLDDDF